MVITIATMKRRKDGIGFGPLVITVFLLTVTGTSGKSAYYMDNKLDCGYIGVQDIARDQVVKVFAKTSDTSTSSQGGCTINFQAQDTDATIHMDFDSFIINSCGVNLYVSGNAASQATSYSCGDREPNTYFTVGRALTLTLHKTDITNMDYNFVLSIKAVRENKYFGETDSNPIGVGLVIGIVGAIFGIIFIIAIIGCCCFRKYRARGPTKSPYLYDPDSKVKLDDRHDVSLGYTNENMKPGDSPLSRKKLLAPSDSSDEKTNQDVNSSRPRTLNIRSNTRSNIPPPPPPPELDGSPPKYSEFNYQGRDNGRKGLKSDAQDKSVNERGIDVETRPANPMLGALKSNSKFRKSYEENERDADDRAKRVSSTSSFEKLGDAPTPPSSEENISRPSLPPVKKSPKSKRSKHATINRQPRPTSMSSDEIAQIEAGTNAAEDDRNIRVVHDESTSSSSEVVAIKVSDPSAKKKPNTTHSLRPDRKGRKKQTQSVSSALDPEPKPSPRAQKDRIGNADLDRVAQTNRDPLNDSFGSGRYKRARKSPKTVRSSGGKGFSHRRGRSVDQLDSRPTTPTSAFGSMEDLESLPPLVRASSKNSLYASRSSLYDRRGRRRKGSYAESVTSYATTRDDMSVMRHSRGYDASYSDDDDDFDGYEKPMSRRDRDRLFRSENDLSRRREISTQTLRETATQTGPNESVTVQPKRLVKKKKRAKSVSSAETQTVLKKNGEGKARSKSTAKDSESGEKQKLKKTKRSKSVDQLDSVLEKPKPKPKPRPRKSTSADTHLEERSKSASNLAEVNQNPYYPQSEGFAPQPYPPGYPMGPVPGYPVQPMGMLGQYPYPMHEVPPGYPGGMYQPPPPQQMGMMNGIPPNQPAPKVRNKSNWERLCELTDGEARRDDMTETGSVASSVFTNNPHVGHQPYYNSQPYYQPPPQQIAGNQAPKSGYYENGFVQPIPQRLPNVRLPPDSSQKQSSYETLKEMTDTREPAPTVQNKRNESIV